MCRLCPKINDISQRVIKMAKQVGLSINVRIKEAQVAVAKQRDLLDTHKDVLDERKQTLAALIASKKAGKK